ncbi:HEAT repeat domain-containing protein [Archangium sp.]|uniref:HEAT repeat domain-containing protein n=1 Tax=Archangium sp. TaxID=1872627 RepID=UPI00286D3029|nr:HEAT repeat domain-containing protein [Archangium sp.]
MFGKHRRPILLSVAVVALVLAVGLVALKPEPPTEPASTQAPTTRAPATSTADPAPAPSLSARKAPDGTRAWVPGMQYRYTLNSDQEVSFTQSQPGAEVPPGMRFRIQGEWSVGVISAEGDRIEARVKLVPATASVSIDGQAALAPEVKQNLQAGLAQPFFLTLNRAGAVQLVHFEPTADVLVQGLLRATVAVTQHVLSGQPQASWQTEELDTTGRYTARYTRQDGMRFERSKLAYTHMATPSGLQPLTQDLRVSISSLTKFELEEDLWARSLQVSERLQVDSGPSMPKAMNTLSVQLLLLGRGQDSSLLGALASRRDQLLTVPLASYQGQAQDPKEAWRQVLAGKTFDELMKDLRSLPADEKESESARTKALEQLRALFLLEPKQALRVPGLLREGMDPLAASPMLGALSAASTSESLKALSQIVGDGALQVPVRTDAVAALGMAPSPNEDSVSALRKMARAPEAELSSTATLGLGNAALIMGEGNARTAESLIHELDSAFRSTNEPQQQALLLRALGNTRHPSVLPTLQSALGSVSPEVRMAAVEALRAMPAPTADQLLASSMLGDPSAEVRQSAVFASGFRPLQPLLPALGQALRADPADAVRAEIITLLGTQLSSLPEVRPLLTWSSQNDTNPTLRNNATLFLNPVAQPTTP